MHYASPDQLTDRYRHVVLSPHLDDAALSCGGLLAMAHQRHEQALVITLCTAAPAADSDFSELALTFHRMWQLSPDEVVSARLREEQAALDILGTDSYWAGLLDAIYRFPQAYTSRDTLFNRPHASDPLYDVLAVQMRVWREQMPSAIFYAPLAVGSHVDHVITHEVARMVFADCPERLVFYEDFPYAIWPRALATRQTEVQDVEPQTIAIEAVLAHKIASVDAYPSQLVELFGSRDGMVQSLTSYAADVSGHADGAGERYWHAHAVAQ